MLEKNQADATHWNRAEKAWSGWFVVESRAESDSSRMKYWSDSGPHDASKVIGVSFSCESTGGHCVRQGAYLCLNSSRANVPLMGRRCERGSRGSYALSWNRLRGRESRDPSRSRRVEPHSVAGERIAQFPGE